MKYSEFKGLKLSKLGFGGMRFPRKLTGKIDYDETEKMIDKAYAAGVNYFDTAYMYHFGESEVVMGKILKKYPRDSYFLADKMPAWFCKTTADVNALFDRQKERCGVDYFDFYLLHSVTEKNYPISEKLGAVDVLLERKVKGEIKHLGFSFHGGEELFKKMLDQYGDVFEFVQLQINYCDWDGLNAKRLYELAREKGLPVIVMEPVKGGALASLSRKARDVFQKYAPDKSVASFALRYAMCLDGVMVTLSGMSDMAQTEDNVKSASEEPLTEADYRTITQALNVYKHKKIIPCTGCRYCMECTVGIDIPGLFRSYNDMKLSGSKGRFKEELKDAAVKPEACIKCNKCVSHCPQGINIPEALLKIEKAAKR